MWRRLLSPTISVHLNQALFDLKESVRPGWANRHALVPRPSLNSGDDSVGFPRARSDMTEPIWRRDWGCSLPGLVSLRHAVGPATRPLIRPGRDLLLAAAFMEPAMPAQSLLLPRARHLAWPGCPVAGPAITVTVVGRIGDDPRTFRTRDGSAGVELRLAVDLPSRTGGD
jgi:hypothetical protein